MNEQERTLLKQLGRTGRAMYAAFESEVGHALPRWRILHTLSECKRVTQKDLVKTLEMDPGALTRQMKSLEADGLVTRQNAPEDNRLTTVVLTRRGVAAIKAARAQRSGFLKKALKGLPKQDVDTTMAVLKHLEERFRRMQAR